MEQTGSGNIIYFVLVFAFSIVVSYLVIKKLMVYVVGHGIAVDFSFITQPLMSLVWLILICLAILGVMVILFAIAMYLKPKEQVRRYLP